MEKSSRHTFLGRAGMVFALAVLMAISVLTLVTTQSASAADLGFQAQPDPGTPNAQLGYFKFDAAAGAAVQQVLVITSHSDEDQALRLAPCDGLSAVYGGVAYSASTAKPTAVGTWIELPQTKVTLPAKGSVKVPFIVHVPADVTTGIHLGGIAIWDPSAATTNAGGGEGSTKATTEITMVTRMVMSVVVTTPGPAVANLTITGVTPQARPDGMYMLVQLDSDGTAPASGAGTISVPTESFQKPIDLGAMVPASGTAYPVLWKGDPEPGSYPVEVAINYDNNTKVATWSGTIDVTGEALDELQDRYVAPVGAAAAGTPWLMYGMIAGLVVIVLFMALLLLRRRRPEEKRS